MLDNFREVKRKNKKTDDQKQKILFTVQEFYFLPWEMKKERLSVMILTVVVL